MKPTTSTPKTSTSKEDSADNESNNIISGLQNRNLPDSDSENENNKKPGVNKAEHRISSNNEKYLLDINENEQTYQHQFFLTNTNSSSKNVWPKDEDDNDKYDGDNNDNGDAKPRVAIRYPTTTSQLQRGSGSPQAKMRREEETKKVPDKNDIAIVDNGKENEEENEQSANKYSKQGIIEKYTSCGYTSNRTSTIDMMSINTNGTVT